MITIISYLITGITLIGTVANSLQKKWCFYIWIPTNFFWVVYNVAIKQYAQAILYTVNTITSIVGLVQWSKKAKDSNNK